MNITEDQFRKTLGLFPTGVTVITAPQKKEGDVGLTVSSFTSVSLDPPQILFCLSKYSQTISAFRATRYFAVNILNSSQAHLSDGFARQGPLEWEKIKIHHHPETGCLLFSNALGHIICEKGAMYEGGDHEIILGRVIDLCVNSKDPPLVRQRGQYLTTQSILVEASPELAYRKSSAS